MYNDVHSAEWLCRQCAPQVLSHAPIPIALPTYPAITACASPLSGAGKEREPHFTCEFVCRNVGQHVSPSKTPEQTLVE